MNEVRKMYVRFYSHGFFRAQVSEREVSTRDPGALEIPSSAFAFEFYDIIQITREDGLVFRSGELDLSPMYYREGRTLTIDEVKATMSENPALIADMEEYNIERVIQISSGKFFPFNPGDVLL